jgi:hypothetical protein
MRSKDCEDFKSKRENYKSTPHKFEKEVFIRLFRNREDLHACMFLLFGMRALNLFILRLLFNGVVTLIHARIKEAFEGF